MSAGYFDKAVRLSFGQVAAGAAIEVRHTGGGLADIYSNAAMTTPFSNPGVLGDDGRYEFYALFGVYNITVGAGASAATYRFKLDSDGVNFLTRDDFVSAVADGYAPAGGTVVAIGGLSWMVIPVGHADYGTDPIPDLPGWMPVGDVTPCHFSDNVPFVTDMTVAVQSAYDYASSHPGVAFDISGRFLVTETINFDSPGTIVYGSGAQSTVQSVILADHVSGPGIHVSGSRQVISGFRVKGSASRESAAQNVACPGILVEPPDTANALMGQVEISNIISDDHNGSAVVINQASGVMLRNVIGSDCRRFGLVVGNQDESTRINKDNRTGQVVETECRFDADWSSRVVGAPSGVPSGASVYRYLCISGDSNRGPVDTTSMTGNIPPCGWWVRAENVTIISSAIDPGDTTDAGLIVSGVNVTIGAGNRFLGLDTCDYGIKVVNWTTNSNKDIMIDRNMVVGTEPNLSFVHLDTTTAGVYDAVDPGEITIIQPNYSGSVVSNADGLRYFSGPDEDAFGNDVSIAGALSVTGSASFAEGIRTPESGFTTISSGVLDLDHAFVKIVGEGVVADDVDTITWEGGTPHDGQVVYLTAGSSTVTITIKHGSGNIRCGSDRVLDHSSDCVTLIYSAAKGYWIMVSFEDNGA